MSLSLTKIVNSKSVKRRNADYGDIAPVTGTFVKRNSLDCSDKLTEIRGKGKTKCEGSEALVTNSEDKERAPQDKETSIVLSRVSPTAADVGRRDEDTGEIQTTSDGDFREDHRAEEGRGRSDGRLAVVQNDNDGKGKSYSHESTPVRQEGSNVLKVSLMQDAAAEDETEPREKCDKPNGTTNRPPLPRRFRTKPGTGSVYCIDLVTGDAEIMTDDQLAEQNAYVSDDVIEALNSITFVHNVEPSSSSEETSSITGSLTSSNRDNDVTNLWMEDHSMDQTIKQVQVNEPVKKKKVFKNPIKMLKKTFSQGEILLPMSIPEPGLDSVKIDSLPQQFVCKFLGRKMCNGLQGLEYIQGPIDRMVREVTGKPKAEELPLVQLTVWPKGFQASLHPKTKSSEFEQFYLPIDFISFCAEHGNYQKIVGMISVTQLGPKTTKSECHAYICHSRLEARKLTVSMATAFKMYAERLGGSKVKFKVDLRPREEKQTKTENKEFEA